MREKIIDLLYAENVRSDCGIERLADEICAINPAKWIPFTERELTAEEQEEHPEWDFILECPLPDDRQEILVSNGRRVWQDEFYSDDGCYLDSDHELEGCAWMPLPDPWRGEEQ